VKWAEFAVPEFAVPEFAVPEFAVPEFAVPEFAVPEFAVPEYRELLRVQGLVSRVLGSIGYNHRPANGLTYAFYIPQHLS